MNTYLIPTTAAYCYEPYDHIYLVYANTSLEAYRKAQTELQGEYIPQESQKYESYPFELYKPNSEVRSIVRSMVKSKYLN